MAAKTLNDYMARHPVFRGLDPAHVRVIAEHAREVEFKRGVLIFRQDTDAEHFYLVREGEVSVEIPSLFGSPITMQVLGPGEVVGWSWIFPPYKWHFDARATEDTRAVQVDGVALRARCDEDPKLGYEIVKHFAAFMMERLNASRRKVMDLYGPEG